ncbi:hypothetical protein BS47DRAFT_1346097, partial [Hydnum rufescens UP504]
MPQVVSTSESELLSSQDEKECTQNESPRKYTLSATAPKRRTPGQYLLDTESCTSLR